MRVGAGIFSESLSVRSSYKLPDNSSVFQVETLAISQSCGIIQYEIEISHGQSDADPSFKIRHDYSAVVKQCLNELTGMRSKHSITLIWVIEHRIISGNERVNKLASRSLRFKTVLSKNVHYILSTLKLISYLQCVSGANN